MARRDVNMLEGSIMKGILAIAIPVMIMNVATSLFNIIDMTVLKTFGGAVGAVGVCGTLISLITGLVIGVSSGSNVIIARYIGRKDSASVDRAINTAMAFSIAAGIALAIIGVVGAPLFLKWNNCPENLLQDATLYFRLYFAGVPILMVYNFCASILRSSGDSRRPMIFLIIGGIVKVLANLVFAGVFHLGVMGVALATILSWCAVRHLLLRLGRIYVQQSRSHPPCTRENDDHFQHLFPLRYRPYDRSVSAGYGQAYGCHHFHYGLDVRIPVLLGVCGLSVPAS